MAEKTENTGKQVVVANGSSGGRKFMMSNGEYTGILVGKEATDFEYVISDGTIAVGSFVPKHYHKWEEQTFHVISGRLRAEVGGESVELGPGGTVHCPRGIAHYLENIGEEHAYLISYIFPGDWAEDFMAETSRQNQTGEVDFQNIEDEYGVVYV